MSAPKPFQKATVTAALRALDGRKSVRRFLVADEVGLGKTIVAREVIREMMRRKAAHEPGPFRVFYVCSSLAIAGQNQDSLLKVLPEGLRDRAKCKVDRLTLIPTISLPKDVPLHIYTLTPETSLPDRKGKHRSGAAPERALIYNLLVHDYHDLVQPPGKASWLRCQATSSWGDWVASLRPKATPSLRAKFLHHARAGLNVPPGGQFPAAVEARLRASSGHLSLIQTFRVALARCGLDALEPDLIVFDEFQKFSDVLLGEEGSSEIAKELVRDCAALLLSATPYHAYGAPAGQELDAAAHQGQFYSLLEWLFGAASGKARAGELRLAFAEYGRALRCEQPGSEVLLNAKNSLEERLRSVMARTERFSHDSGQDGVELTSTPTPLHAADLTVYRHLSDSLAASIKGASALSAAVPYWTSVPLPMQALGPGYHAWRDARRPMPAIPSIQLTERDRNTLGAPDVWPHPRLRALSRLVPAQDLSLPWLPASNPWWRSRGIWKDASARKILLFSRFRAVPRTVAALLSYQVERHLLPSKGFSYGAASTVSPLTADVDNLAFFHPSAFLASAFDPYAERTDDERVLRNRAQAATQSWLIGQSIPVSSAAGQSRSLPALLVGIERALGRWGESEAAWRGMAVELARSDAPGQASLRAIVGEWNGLAPNAVRSVTKDELDLLADWVLRSPGAVLARSLSRVGGTSTKECVDACVRASWQGLRSYLNNPWMNAALDGDSGGRDYRERIGRAILDGNLESVLDEQLWCMVTHRSASGEGLAKGLQGALSIRTGNATLHGLSGGQFTLRAHAALAFTDRTRHHLPDQQGDDEHHERTEDVRNAFNSPFWPHVLTSTSVGQEGLDFHAWCSTVAHWDIPSDPVDLEQREGRVDRYGGVAIRKAMAQDLGPSLAGVAAGGSPWARLAVEAERLRSTDESGLTPWWLYPKARVSRVVFDVPLSEANARFDDLRRRRMLYRLTLGQPDQEDLVRALHGRFTEDEARAATINLSPWGRE